uniref:multiple epidermal growth factor-like domains protein 8 isoform X2 n=1 Tax=Ciona intestinalis TaxID=7719 RepID=UPI000EF4A28B|nr:multiple epidermal growth factor-like domains protein 8 isoform X2 [Ciona intestinalis]|eukprot:XP_026689374.1 multiple epidermal growth factor-like domains protein 8 isoform X2 [Ciona intestinalis]
MLLYFFRCSCNAGWIGTSCNQRGCPNNCNAPHGICDFERSKRCICNAGYIGKGCNLYTSSSSQNNSWTAVNNFTFFGDAAPSLSFHAAEFVHSFLYIFGGYDLNAMKNGLYRYNFRENFWTSLRTNMIGPAPRAFHTMNYIRTEYLDQLLIFGGQFENGSYSNDMWMFNITSNSWHLVIPSNNISVSRKLSQHAACVVEHSNVQYLYVFGGLVGKKDDSTFSSDLHMFDVRKKKWSTLSDSSGTKETKRRLAGHSMVYDNVTHTLIVFGGFLASKSIANRSNRLLFFNILKKYWYEFEMNDSPPPMAFHSANIAGDYMIIHGGSVHMHESDESCYSDNTYFYHLRCASWKSSNSHHGGRYGHVSAMFNQNVVLYHGGYDGTVSNSLLAYKVPKYAMNTIPYFEICQSYTVRDICSSDVRCVWCEDGLVSHHSFCTNKENGSNSCNDHQLTPSTCGGMCQHLKVCFSCSTVRRFDFLEGEWVAGRCIWNVHDRKCSSANTTTNNLPGDETLERSWRGNPTTNIITSKLQCVNMKLAEGFISQYFRDDITSPYKVAFVQGPLSLTVVHHGIPTHNYTVAVQGYLHPLNKQLFPNHILRFKLTSRRGSAKFYLSRDDNDTNSNLIVQTRQNNNFVRSTSHNIHRRLSSTARYYYKLIFTHTGESHSNIQPEVSVAWTARSNSNPHLNFSIIQSRFLEPYNTDTRSNPCNSYLGCLSCLADYSCVWFIQSNTCAMRSDVSNSDLVHGLVTDPHLCEACADYTSCNECNQHHGCLWSNHGVCHHTIETELIKECPTSCFGRKTCQECLNGRESGGELCTWCESSQTCYSFKLHLPLNLFASCTEWFENPMQCKNCSGHTTCGECNEDYLCGWCSSQENRLIGSRCLFGHFHLPHSECPINNPYSNDLFDWDYATCPDVDECEMRIHSCDINALCLNNMHSYTCQCNRGYTGDGNSCVRTCDIECVHGVCSNEPDYACVCDLGWLSMGNNLTGCDEQCLCNFHSTCNTDIAICDACQHNTQGVHCEQCIVGSYGDATSHAGCNLCDCNGHGDLQYNICNSQSGACFCTGNTAGDHCEMCAAGYYGNSTNHGVCYKKCQGRHFVRDIHGSGAFGTLFNSNEKKYCWFIIQAHSTTDIVKLVFNNLKIKCEIERMYIYDGIPSHTNASLLAVVCNSFESNFVFSLSDTLTVVFDAVALSSGFSVVYNIVSRDNDSQILSTFSMINSCHASSESRELKIMDGTEGIHRINLLNNPNPAFGHTLVSYKDSLMLFGGFRFGVLDSSVYIYNTTNMLWTPIMSTVAPTGRYFHASVSVPTLNRMLVFGGITFNQILSNELWEFYWSHNFTNNKWRLIESNSTPPMVAAHTFTQCQNGDFILIGGLSVNGKINKEIWKFNLYTSSWKQLSSRGLNFAVFGHTSICDVTNNVIYIFGGWKAGKNAISNNLYLYDITCERWKHIDTRSDVHHPPAMMFHSAAQFNTVSDRGFVIFAGGVYVKNDIWKYSFGSHSWTNLTSPARAQGIGMGSSAVTINTTTEGLYIYVYSGNYDGLFYNHLHMFNASCSLTDAQQLNEEVLEGRNEPTVLCNDLKSCRECNLHFSYQRSCMWINDQCVVNQCSNNETMENIHSFACSVCSDMDCEDCYNSAHCHWVPGNVTSHNKNGYCEENTNNTTQVKKTAPLAIHNYTMCFQQCSIFTSCNTCLSNYDDISVCLWSTQVNKCMSVVESILQCSAGLCGHVVQLGSQCPTPCSYFTYCNHCLLNEGCGWVGNDDGSGHGECTAGTYLAPIDLQAVDSSQWWFISCPQENECLNGHASCQNQDNEDCQDTHDAFECVCAPGYTRDNITLLCKPHCQSGCVKGDCIRPDVCQCNFGYTGESCDLLCPCNHHSDCIELTPDTYNCTDCLHNTVGESCDRCKHGYVGNPINNQTCVPCHVVCNQRSNVCVRKSTLTFYRSQTINLYGPSHVDDAVCVDCDGNSSGDYCNECIDGYFMLNGACHMCYCNGHGDNCDKITGSWCNCRNHTTTSNPLCNEPSRFLNIDDKCWQQQCDACQGGFKGNPINGGHCYRLVSINDEWCFDPTLLPGCATHDYNKKLEMKAGSTILFALHPKFLNVDMRLIVEVSSGTVDIFISDSDSVFRIVEDSTFEQKVEISASHNNSLQDRRIERSVLNNSNSDGSLHDNHVMYLNTSGFNSYTTIAPNKVLHVQNLQNMLVVSFPHSQYNFETGIFYVVILSRELRYEASNKSVLEKTSSGRLLFRQDQTRVDLFVFFSVFFSCFFLFLSICVVAWKIRQAVAAQRNLLAHHIQLQHMASRPFACIYLYISHSSTTEVYTKSDAKKILKSKLSYLSKDEPSKKMSTHQRNVSKVLLPPILKCSLENKTPDGFTSVMRKQCACHGILNLMDTSDQRSNVTKSTKQQTRLRLHCTYSKSDKNNVEKHITEEYLEHNVPLLQNLSSGVDGNDEFLHVASNVNSTEEKKEILNFVSGLESKTSVNESIELPHCVSTPVIYKPSSPRLSGRSLRSQSSFRNKHFFKRIQSRVHGPLSFEPTSDGQAGVATVFIQLPSASTIGIGSALMNKKCLSLACYEESNVLKKYGYVETKRI